MLGCALTMIKAQRDWLLYCTLLYLQNKILMSDVEPHDYFPSVLLVKTGKIPSFFFRKWMESQLTKRDKKALKTIFLKVKTFCWPYSLVSYLVPAMVLSLCHDQLNTDYSHANPICTSIWNPKYNFSWSGTAASHISLNPEDSTDIFAKMIKEYTINCDVWENKFPHIK